MMFIENQCPGCGGANTELLENIPTDALIKGYRGFVDDPMPFFGSVAQTIKFCRCKQCDLRWFANAPAGDASFYEDLQRHDWYYQSEKSEYHFAATKVRAGNSVLEVGCGRGAFAAHLRGVKYRGIEFNEKAVKAACAANLDVVMVDVEQEALKKPNSYDVVCHFQVLEHVTAPAAFMSACVAALKPGGLLIVAVPAEDSFLALVEDGWLNMPPHHLTRWTDASLAAMFQRVGLELVETWHETVADYHVKWHRETVARAGLKSLHGASPDLVSTRVRAKISRTLSGLPVFEDWLFRRGLAAHAHAAMGHTVCMVGRKR